jgi:hypothetical protein
MRVMGMQLHSFLTSVLDGEVTVTFRPLYPEKKILGTHRMRLRVGSSADLELLKDKKIPCSCRDSKII